MAQKKGGGSTRNGRDSKPKMLGVKAFGGEYLLRAPGAECLEGGFGQEASMVISKWPDRAAAKAFWDSPEYAEARKLREGLADVQVMLIDGSDLSA